MQCEMGQAHDVVMDLMQKANLLNKGLPSAYEMGQAHDVVMDLMQKANLLNKGLPSAV